MERSHDPLLHVMRRVGVDAAVHASLLRRRDARAPASMLDSPFAHPCVDSCVREGYVPARVGRTITLFERPAVFAMDTIFVRFFRGVHS